MLNDIKLKFYIKIFKKFSFFKKIKFTCILFLENKNSSCLFDVNIKKRLIVKSKHINK